MGRKSAINRAKKLDLAERARHMTGAERLAACVNLARETAEIQSAGRRHRQADAGKKRR